MKTLEKHDPLYLQLVEVLLEGIRSGDFAVGHFLPSERKLAERYGVTRITVRGALQQLQRRGLVSRDRGRRSKLVRSPTALQTVELFCARWCSPFADASYSDLCEGVSAGVKDRLARLVLSHILSAEDLERHVQRFQEPGVDGLIITGNEIRYREALPAIEQNSRVVVIGTPRNAARADVLLPDYGGAVTKAMEHLHGLGHRRFLLLGGAFPEADRDAENVAAYREAIAERGIPPEDAHVWMQPDDVPASRRFAALLPRSEGDAPYWIDERLFEIFKPPLALVATGPSFAVSARILARRRGLRVPDDVAIVATQDSTWLPTHEPPITGVSILSHDVGAMAARWLFERMDQPERPQRIERAPIQLVVRGSCGAAGDAKVIPGVE